MVLENYLTTVKLIYRGGDEVSRRISTRHQSWCEDRQTSMFLALIRLQIMKIEFERFHSTLEREVHSCVTYNVKEISEAYFETTIMLDVLLGFTLVSRMGGWAAPA